MSKQNITNRQLKPYESLAFGAGDVAASLVWNAASAFALYFYTDIALLPAAAIGSLLFFSRLFDAFFDIGVGIAVDRTKSRWGKARPYLLFGAIPFGLFGALTFYVPVWSDSSRLYYAVVTYFILGLLLSLVTIPYSAMLPMLSNHPQDRIDLSAARSVATSIGVIAVTALFMPGVEYFGKGDVKQGFFIMASITAIISVALLLMTFWHCQERQTLPVSNTKISNDITQLFKNRAWNVSSFFALLNFIRFGAILSLTPFFAINVLQQPWMISVLLPTLSGTLLIGAFIARPLLNRFGYIKADTVALSLSLACYFILPIFEKSPWIFITLYVLASLSLSITMTSIYAMASDAVDIHQQLFNQRQEGLLAAGISLAIKIGMAIGSASIAYVLAWVDYSPTNITDTSLTAMQVMYYGIPIAIFMLQIICIQFYPQQKISIKK